MPIYEYYCPDNHTVYQFYAKTLAQGRTVPPCPANPAYRMEKMLSPFAVRSGGERPEPAAGAEASADPQMEAAMGVMEREFAQVDEKDPKAMARMMRRMAELSGEKIDAGMEEVVRKLEEGVDPETLEEQLGGEPPCSIPDPAAESLLASGKAGGEPVTRDLRLRRPAPLRRDPKLYDYP